MPIAQKNESLGAKASTSSPFEIAARTYSIPSARVNANSITAFAPASCMWYPLIEIELNFGIFLAVNSIISATILMLGSGG